MVLLNLTTATPPVTRCVTLDAVKAYLRLDGFDENDLLLTLVDAATEQAETFTGRSFINRQLRLTLDYFPQRRSDAWWDGVVQGPIASLVSSAQPITLPRPPLVSVDSITTYAADNTATVADASTYGINTSAASVALKSGFSWPDALRNSAAVEILYTAGYGAAPAALPSRIRLAILQQVALLYENRDGGCLCDASMESLSSLRIIPGV